MAALDQSLYHLALAIEEIDRNNFAWDKSVFKRTETHMEKIMNVLISMSEETLRAAITGKLHNLLSHPTLNTRLPEQFKINLEGSVVSQERPVIYTLIHCSSTFRTPTKAEYLEVLKDIKVYNTYYSRIADWQVADTLAHSIDHVQPTINDRNWIWGTQGKSKDKWATNNDGSAIPHPRRYTTSKLSRERINEFIQNSKERLNRISDDRNNDPIPWAMVYTGWTSKEGKRAYDHSRHGTGSAIA